MVSSHNPYLILMVAHADNGCMFALIFFLAIAAVCVLGAVYGADSRHSEPTRHRSNL